MKCSERESYRQSPCFGFLHVFAHSALYSSAVFFNPTSSYGNISASTKYVIASSVQHLDTLHAVTRHSFKLSVPLCNTFCILCINKNTVAQIAEYEFIFLYGISYVRAHGRKSDASTVVCQGFP